MTHPTLDTMAKALQPSWVANHLSSPMGETKQKVVAIASSALGIAGSVLLMTAGFHGAVTIPGFTIAMHTIALSIGAVTISPLSLYIAGAVLLTLAIYLCARSLCSTDQMSYGRFVNLLNEKVNDIKKGHEKVTNKDCLPSQNQEDDYENDVANLVVLLNGHLRRFIHEENVENVITQLKEEIAEIPSISETIESCITKALTPLDAPVVHKWGDAQGPVELPKSQEQ